MLNNRVVPAVAFACLLSIPIGARAQTPERAELMKSPKYASKDAKPALKKISADELRTGIKVSSGRSSALFGFNNPSVEVHLPRIDNSVYAEDEWETPKLLDAKGRSLAFEKEQGLYDHRTFNTEIRFADSEGKPKSYAKAVGSMTIVYPIAMHSVSVKKSDTAKAKALGIVFDGPYVKVYGGEIAEAAFGNDIESVRAYDTAGKRLERVMGYSSSGFDDTGSYQQKAYHGEVARVDADLIDERVGFRIDYEMPPAPSLPSSMAGATSSAPASVPEIPGGRFTLTPFRVFPAAMLGRMADYSPEDARHELLQLHEIREANSEALTRAATDGDADVIRLCLIAGVDPDAGLSDNTPLLLAASFGHVDASLVLIAAGARVDARNQNNATPLLQAAGRCEADELVRALLKAGADPNVKAAGGITPLGMANAVNCSENAAALAKAGGR